MNSSNEFKTVDDLPNILINLTDEIKFVRKHMLRDIATKGKKSLCKSKLRKNELILFFSILMEEEMFFFDEVHTARNRLLFQKFIQKNFTYLGDSGVQTNVNNPSRQFSEAKGFVYRDKQIRFLDKMIHIFTERKARISKD